jgi:hypothetical protein
MNGDDQFEAGDLPGVDLESIAQSVRELADRQRGNSLALLALLRLLEHLHQEIRDSLFQDSLPDNRQALYRLLRNIEAAGGWPYIHRLKLQALLIKLEESIADEILLTSPTPGSQKPPET